jgi:hypothetical protein
MIIHPTLLEQIAREQLNDRLRQAELAQLINEVKVNNIASNNLPEIATLLSAIRLSVKKSNKIDTCKPATQVR